MYALLRSIVDTILGGVRKVGLYAVVGTMALGSAVFSATLVLLYISLAYKYLTGEDLSLR